MFLLRILTAFVVVWNFTVLEAKNKGKQQVFLVSFDGFRYDYLTKFNLDLPNFARIAKTGVTTTSGNIPPFFTYTFPSHYTTVTGLYEESHGIVGNKFYDPELDETFNMYNQDFDPKWWNGGEPIWVTARLKGLTSATFFWPGSEVEIRGWRPNQYKKFNNSVTFEERVDQSLQWLVEGIDVVCAYFNEPDHMGHSFGPHSLEVKEAVKTMDGVLGRILDGLKKHQLEDKVNFLLTADHGMSSISPDRSIDLDDYVDRKSIWQITAGSASFIRPNDLSKTNEIYEKLKGAHPMMTVFLKEDIPDRWHYKNNRRISPIYAVADEGWYINSKYGFPIAKETGKPLKGTHGYDNLLGSMSTIFFATGPSIAANKSVSPFESVNYYPLMCDLLGIAASPNNGSRSSFESVLANSALPSKSVADASVVFALFCIQSFIAVMRN